MSDDVILGLEDYKYYKDNLWQWGQTQIEDDSKLMMNSKLKTTSKWSWHDIIFFY